MSCPYFFIAKLYAVTPGFGLILSPAPDDYCDYHKDGLSGNDEYETY